MHNSGRYVASQINSNFSDPETMPQTKPNKHINLGQTQIFMLARPNGFLAVNCSIHPIMFSFVFSFLLNFRAPQILF